MDLVQLEHFLAVADEHSFTRAAERVFRTQPALSQSIKKLEAELGASLFMRDNGDVSADRGWQSSRRLCPSHAEAA